ncbi:hypothetical protein QYF36_005406 [Acer negundo]|nr:hypothetical protein QYF36_005406 [Acer negundo]
MWVVMEINGEILTSLLDTSSSRNLLAKAVVDRLGIQSQRYSSMIQGVNGDSTFVVGLLDMCLQIGHWSGTCTLLVLPLDNVECILGMGFFVPNKVTFTPHLGGMLISDGTNQCYLQARFDCDKKWSVQFQELIVPKEAFRHDMAMIEALRATIDHLLEILSDNSVNWDHKKILNGCGYRLASAYHINH